MTTPEEKLAAEMYPYVDNRTAFVTGHRLGKAEGDAKGYARAVEDCAKLAERYGKYLRDLCRPSHEASAAGHNIACAIRALSPTSPAPGAGERAENTVEECAVAAETEINEAIGYWLNTMSGLPEGEDVGEWLAGTLLPNVGNAIRSLAAAPDKEG